MLTLQDAKNRFSAVVEAALSGRPQEVSRRGKPAVVVVAAEEYARLVRIAAAR
ncbi:type II toxin-antitoxin system prevent-host-death family antitoxin, partial [Puniceibacterium confluentis]